MSDVCSQQFVIFGHRIRQQIATKLLQPRFKFAVLPFDLDLHVFPDSNAAHFRHSQVTHRVTHRVSLRIRTAAFGITITLAFICSTISAEGQIRPVANLRCTAREQVRSIFPASYVRLRQRKRAHALPFSFEKCVWSDSTARA